MRLLLLALGLILALPASAQVVREHDVVITTDSTDGGARILLRRTGPDGAVETETIRLPGMDDLPMLFERLPHAMRGLPLREGGVFDLLPAPGVSDATRERMRDLEVRSHGLAVRARGASGAERERLVGELDDVLAELFEVRADARREEAAHLRQRADEIETGLRDRQRRRDEILDARRREMLGSSDDADW